MIRFLSDVSTRRWKFAGNEDLKASMTKRMSPYLSVVSCARLHQHTCSPALSSYLSCHKHLVPLQLCSIVQSFCAVNGSDVERRPLRFSVWLLHSSGWRMLCCVVMLLLSSFSSGVDALVKGSALREQEEIGQQGQSNGLREATQDTSRSAAGGPLSHKGHYLNGVTVSI
ncbi:hypothetical protein E1301_Tti003621 [Triplophysa tibetana]|uniref:Uncharacterized protein n=1 Tax=Triplophysa tibetana TaxID=1572043 RepID=A0A5A9PR32_9TELE|nr:hypothetical protein E1301_Tti003621 [Triplophysa tibetana]